MNAIALMFHDVVPPGLEDSSGFPGGDAARYKLTPEQFGDHMRTIRRRLTEPPVTVDTLVAAVKGRRVTVPRLLTFDDGGTSAARIADSLEVFGWRGHFFVTAGYIDAPRFLTRAQIRDLRRRGHVIGSHTSTHPLRLARCSIARLRAEWTDSTGALADLLGETITAASVPGGDHSGLVAATAAEAGLRFLFTSRPTVAIRRHGDMFSIGRFVVRRSTSPDCVAAVAAGALAPRLRQLLWWDLKRVAKATAGETYLKVRERLLGCSAEARWGDELKSA